MESGERRAESGERVAPKPWRVVKTVFDTARWLRVAPAYMSGYAQKRRRRVEADKKKARRKAKYVVHVRSSVSA